MTCGITTSRPLRPHTCPLTRTVLHELLGIPIGAAAALHKKGTSMVRIKVAARLRWLSALFLLRFAAMWSRLHIEVNLNMNSVPDGLSRRQ